MAATSDLRFFLRADGCIHSGDVRHLSSADELLLTASRDNTAMLIPTPPLSCTITPGLSFVGHKEFVNFALFHPSIGLLEGRACVVTGSNDKHVALWNPQTAALEAVMDGHAYGVCCGVILSQRGGDIVTGDWGGICIVFDGTTGCVKNCYSEHGAAVRALTHLPGTNSIVSASSDKKVHQWDVVTGTTTAVFVGHEDVVQCVCAMSATRFATGGNDATIIIWDTTTGTAPLHVLKAHDSLLYALCYCPARRLLFSVSEDRTLKIWKGGMVDVAASGPFTEAVVAQSINHPCVIWSVCVTSTGDIATGGSDGVLRLWTTENEKVASIPKLKALENAVAAQTIDVKIAIEAGLVTESLPQADELHLRQGMWQGERLFARTEAGLIEAYAWNWDHWDKVGTVVEGTEGQAFTGAPQPKAKVYLDDVPHDYVFDVDVNGKMLKLTYDKGQSIFDAAQNFINENRTTVSQTHKEEIQNFILKNVDPKDIQQGEGLPLTTTLGGEGGGAFSNVTSTGVAEPLFSTFAQEAAALRQAGQSHIPSWGEALRNLESSGVSANNVAFSTYAREGALLQQQASQETVTSQSTAETGSADRSIVRWDSFKLFTTFNAAGAQKKIDEWTGETRFSALVERTLAAAAGNANKTVIDDVVALYNRLPECSRFPAVDLLGHLLAVTSHPFNWLQLLIADGDKDDNSPLQAFMRERVQNLHQVPDAEALVTTRLFAHIVAALDKSPPGVTLSSNQLSLIAAMLTKAPQPLLNTKNNNLKSAISALMRNAAVFLVKDPSMLGTDGVRDVTQGLVQIVAKWLIFESISSPFTRELVATLMTLMLSDNNGGRGVAVAVAVEIGHSALSHTLRALKEGPEPHCREAATQLLSLLDKE